MIAADVLTLFRMGANVRIRTLHDALRHGFIHIEVTCGNRACGRSGRYATQNILSWFAWPSRRNPHLDVAGSYFRCETCGHRGASLKPLPPPSLPDPPKLEPTAGQLRRRAGRERG